jgi:hypothetical protein
MPGGLHAGKGETIKKDPVLTGPNISGECMGQSRRDLQIETPHALVLAFAQRQRNW